MKWSQEAHAYSAELKAHWYRYSTVIRLKRLKIFSTLFQSHMPKHKKRGGARPGAGRPKGPGLVQVKVWVLPETKDALREAATALGTTKSQYVERAIRMLAVKEKVP